MSDQAINIARKLRTGISEADLQRTIIEYAQLNGWLVYHTHDSRHSAAGFPDLTLVRERVIFAELKSEKGQLSADQQVWVARLKAAGADAQVWRPSDWDQIAETLRRAR